MSKRKVDEEDTEIDLTSMIDVCFLLIAFFIMVTEVSKMEVVEVFLPIATNAIVDENPPENRVILNINRQGEVVVRGRNFGLACKPETKKQLIPYMAALSKEQGFEAEAPHASKLTVYVRADAHTRYQYVQCVMMVLVNKDASNSTQNVKVRRVHYSVKNTDML